ADPRLSRRGPGCFAEAAQEERMEEGDQPRDPDGAVLLVLVTSRPSHRAVRAHTTRRGRPLRGPKRFLKKCPSPASGEVRWGRNTRLPALEAERRPVVVDLHERHRLVARLTRELTEHVALGPPRSGGQVGGAAGPAAFRIAHPQQ